MVNDRKGVTFGIDDDLIDYFNYFAARILYRGQGDELHAKDLAKTFHLRGNVCIWAAAVSHNNAGVVDDTAGAGAVLITITITYSGYTFTFLNLLDQS